MLGQGYAGFSWVKLRSSFQARLRGSCSGRVNGYIASLLLSSTQSCASSEQTSLRSQSLNCFSIQGFFAPLRCSSSSTQSCGFAWIFWEGLCRSCLGMATQVFLGLGFAVVTQARLRGSCSGKASWELLGYGYAGVAWARLRGNYSGWASQ